MRRFVSSIIFLFFLLLLTAAGAQTYTAVLPVGSGAVEVHSTEIAEEDWLFLPAFADLSALSIAELPDGYSLEPDEHEEGVWLLNADGADLRIMKSQNLRSLFLFSSDPVNQGRTYIESDPGHALETTGSMALVGSDGQVNFAGNLSQIRGRGNSTWGYDKKPYQIKLEDKFDLLNTGDPAEKNRTWVLLADAVDATFLSNRISLDLAKEIGLSESSHCEHVDLYYDGEYRGLYLLSEKVEVGEGRTDEFDYGKLIKKWNRWIGQRDLSVLPRVEGQNAYGEPIWYTEGVVDNGGSNAGSYLIELYSRDTPYAKSGFTLEGNWSFKFITPEYISKDMVCYVSELLSDGRAALKNNGIHPITGESVEKWFDLDSFVPVVLLYELTHNMDVFLCNSTYYVLPAGETRFVAGPVWDFDRAMRNPEYCFEAGYTWGLKSSWGSAFYSLPAFMESAQTFYENILYPTVTDILLGEVRGRYLRPLDEYVQEIRMAVLMNQQLWSTQMKDSALHYTDSFDTEIAYLRRYIEQQNEYLYQAIVYNGESDADHINMTMLAEWAYAEEPLEFQVFPWSKVTVQSYIHEQLTEATEEDYAVWHVELVLAPHEGYAFENPQVWINNGRFAGAIQPDGTLLVEFLFEDLSYRPLDYDDEDIGLVFNPDFYAFNYPEVAKACDYHPELLLEYFCDEGMYEGHVGNGFFDPREILFYHPMLHNLLGENWNQYYWEFLYYGYEDEAWLEPMDKQFAPPVFPC